MQKSSLFLVAVIFASSVVYPAVAQQGKKAPARLSAPVVAVVDMRSVMRESLAGKSIQTQFDKLRRQFQKEIDKEEKSFRAAREELTRQRSILAPEALRQRQARLEQRFAALQRSMQVRKKELEGTVADARRVLNRHLQKVFEKMIKDRGIDIIIAKRQLVYIGPAFDITKATLKRLNKRLPRVAIKRPVKGGTKGKKSKKGKKDKK
jgi:Skp family chaperone for outer membrane proteins